MLRDITIGQYFPGHSFIHKMDPRMKIIAAVLYIVVLFVASRPLGLALGIAIVVLMYAVSKISPKMVVKSLKPVVPIIIFTAVLNLFFLTGQGDPLLHVGFIRIYREGVAMAIMMAVRIMCLDCRHLAADLHHLPDRADRRHRGADGAAEKNQGAGT